MRAQNIVIELARLWMHVPLVLRNRHDSGLTNGSLNKSHLDKRRTFCEPPPLNLSHCVSCFETVESLGIIIETQNKRTQA
mgnify:CR=1 FL=1